MNPAPGASSVLLPNRCLSGTLSGNNCRLAAGSAMEFSSNVSFTLTADAPVHLAQLLPGSGNQGTATSAVEGDPSLIMVPPVERWRSRYTVYSPPGFRSSWLGFAYETARVSQVLVDGFAVPGFTAVGAFSVANYAVAPGAHVIEVVSPSGAGAGVTVYGYDQYVSYGHMGGL